MNRFRTTANMTDAYIAQHGYISDHEAQGIGLFTQQWILGVCGDAGEFFLGKDLVTDFSTDPWNYRWYEKLTGRKPTPSILSKHFWIAYNGIRSYARAIPFAKEMDVGDDDSSVSGTDEDVEFDFEALDEGDEETPQAPTGRGPKDDVFITALDLIKKREKEKKEMIDLTGE